MDESVPNGTVLIVLSLLLAACTAAEPTLGPGTFSELEYAVYSAVIEAYASELRIAEYTLLINDHTGLDTILAQDLERLKEQIPHDLPGLTPEIIDDLQAKNEQPYALQPLIRLSTPYRLVSEQEKRSLFGESRHHEECYAILREQHPDARGFVTVSRVGFDASMSKALVYIGSSVCNHGGGHLLFLAEENGVWTVQGRTMRWIS